MRYRTLGRTAIDVGIVGLGAEYLEFASKDTVISVVHEAIDKGVNYIDLFMASPDVRDNFGIALKDKRQEVMVAGHLGAALENGQYCRTRDRAISEHFFNDLLRRLQTDYIDALMLHYVDEPDDYERVFSPGGLLELAQRLKKEGKARFVGMSSHAVPTALRAVKSGHIDVLMTPVNLSFDIYPVPEPNCSDNNQDTVKATLDRRELYHTCASKGVGIVAMKPYAAGHLLSRGNPPLTPIQCISYALSQAGVCTVVPGCKNVEEMDSALAYLDSTEEEKDYSGISENLIGSLRGNCMYCNHCLPCPVGIDIATVTRLTDTAAYGISDSVLAEYESLTSKASDCTECGICAENCPFGVDVTANMTRAVQIFNA